jgi:adenosylmethionine-8-amino-7-oxononanoate aminotransferase
MKVNPDQSNVIHFNLKRDIPIVDYGEGIYLIDKDGKRYIDACSGPVAANIGQGVKEVADDMARQAARVAFAYRTQFSSEPIEQFASMIAKMAPEHLNRVFFTTSGSDATEIGARFARQYHLERGEEKRHLIVSRWLSYHGITLDALSMSGLVMRRKHFVPTLVQYPKIPACYCYRCPCHLEYPQCNIACARKLEEAIQLAGPENVSAFIAEPVVGAAAGAIAPPPEYFPIIRDICSRYGVLMIVDEIMTGFGRTGANFAVDHWNVEPDMIAFAKGASAGYWPTAGIIVTDKLYSVLRDGSGVFSPGHTYSGTPLMGSVGIKVLEYIETNRLVQHVADTGPYLMERLNSLRAHQIVGDVRGMGFFTGIEFVRDKATKAPFEFAEFSRLSGMIVAKSFENGLIVYPGGGTVDGFKGDHILVAPPLITTREEIDLITQKLDQSIAQVEQEVLAKA